jgi:hypothetical protein
MTNHLAEQIKRKTSELIALCETHKKLKAVHGQLPVVDDNEVNRLWVMAQNHYTDACEFAVKAAEALVEETTS